MRNRLVGALMLAMTTVPAAPAAGVAMAATPLYTTLVHPASQVEAFALGPDGVDHILMDDGLASDAGGTWTINPSVGGAWPSDMKIDASGHVFVVAGGARPFQVISDETGAWTWTQPAPPSPAGAGYTTSLKLAVAANDDLAVVWTVDYSSVHLQRRIGGVWQAVEDLVPRFIVLGR